MPEGARVSAGERLRGQLIFHRPEDIIAGSCLKLPNSVVHAKISVPELLGKQSLISTAKWVLGV